MLQLSSPWFVQTDPEINVFFNVSLTPVLFTRLHSSTNPFLKQFLNLEYQDKPKRIVLYFNIYCVYIIHVKIYVNNIFIYITGWQNGFSSWIVVVCGFVVCFSLVCLTHQIDRLKLICFDPLIIF